MAEINKVEEQADGSVVYTHGHRYPDNVQVVEQHHDASGRLTSARVTWSGFAGEVLNVTATFDEQGQLVQEQGFRAPEMKTAVSELILPLPVAATTPAPAAAAGAEHAQATPPAQGPSLGEALRKIYPAS